MKINIGDLAVHIDGMIHERQIQILPSLSIFLPNPGNEATREVSRFLGLEKDPTVRESWGVDFGWLIFSASLDFEKGGNDEN